MDRPIPLVPSSLRWAVVGLVAAGIVAVSVVPTGTAVQTTGPLDLVGVDKYFHALGYAGLAVTLAYALAEWSPRRAAAAVFATAFVCGLAVELLQLSLPYRQYSGLDLLANAVGATVVASTWAAVGGRLRFRRVRTATNGDVGRREA